MTALFFVPVYDLAIEALPGKGLRISEDIFLCTDNSFKQRIFSKDLVQPIGTLEYDNLFECPVFYQISEVFVENSNRYDLLHDFLLRCQSFLTALWEHKDNAADLQMGFVQYPYTVQSPFIQSAPSIDNRFMITSNLTTASNFNCRGKRVKTKFSREELEGVISFYKDSILIPPAEKKSIGVNDAKTRQSRAHLFIQIARSQHDLALKISQYCTVLECLFTTDSKELSHKVAERAALLIASTSEEGIKIYYEVKEIYSVRSSVFHGSSISIKKRGELERIAVAADNIVRRAYKCIIMSPELDKYYRTEKAEDLDKFFLGLLFQKTQAIDTVTT